VEVEGGGIVRSGDVVVGDLDGVVVVPWEMVGKVLVECEKGVEVDGKCMDDLKAGRGVEETFKKWRGK
jgi:regulator of RNase E activity RraA